MTRRIIRTAVFLMAAVLMLSINASAADYTKKGTYKWVEKGGLSYAYDAVTGELITNSKVGKCYVDQNGTKCLNQFVNGVYYNPKGQARKKFKGGWYSFEGKHYYFYNQKMATGYKKINRKYYYFSDEGVRLSGLFFVEGEYRYFKKNGVQYMKKGWKEIDGKRYYLSKKGVIKEGFFQVDKNKYYQNAVSGIVTGEQEINGKKYYFRSDGVYDQEKTQRMQEKGALGQESDILFFTKFESGNVGYAQTGGDNGKACGKYQFDYRYALIPFLNYSYSEDPVFCKGFKPFLSIPAGSSRLIWNQKLYDAWKACYDADPEKFSALQDQYAMKAYYEPSEKYLADRGIHLASRPFAIRGAVFSYSIQEGSLVAAQAVIAAGVNDSTPNREFLEKLYDYRWKDPRGWNRNPIFRYRYTQERALALKTLEDALKAA